MTVNQQNLIRSFSPLLQDTTRSNRYVDQTLFFFFVFLVHIHSYSTFLLFIKQQIAHATVRKLSEVKGISEAKVLKLKELVKTLVPMEFMSVRLLDCLGCLSFCCSFS